MKRTYLNENNEIVSVLADRNEEIKSKLSTILDNLIAEQNSGLSLKKPIMINVNYRFIMQLDNVLRSYGLMTAEEVVAIDYDEIEDNWNYFRDLIAYYNQYLEVVANKQLFCAFMRINNRIYSQLESSNDEDIRDLMVSINDSFISLAFIAGESGNANAKAVDRRLRAQDVGHSVISAAEDKFIATTTQKSPQELQKQMLLVVGDTENIKKLK